MKESFKPMWEQVDGVYNIIAPILETSPQGAILIGHSQGRQTHTHTHTHHNIASCQFIGQESGIILHGLAM